MHFRFYQKKRPESWSKLSMVYCKYNCVQYVQSAVFCKPVVSQSSCSIMPVLTEHRLEIAGLVLRGREKTQLEQLPCAQRCEHNIIKWKKTGNNGQGQGNKKSFLIIETVNYSMFRLCSRSVIKWLHIIQMLHAEVDANLSTLLHYIIRIKV